jgi:HEPN domain-containing protein
LPRKTDANNPADWLWLADGDLEAVRLVAANQVSYNTCRSKLAEALEKLLKAELIRTGWVLEKTHDLDRLLDALVARKSDLLPLAEPLCDALAEVYFADRYPGFDLEDPDWPALLTLIQSVGELSGRVRAKLTSRT